ncbi:hypothetical protein EJ02DRAFT_469414 [Clathrospora elynae]|uniref:Uncharacterized protein n=1 Tax=Clathrospora elynae TaxID=706981 RepID=A0A6A5SB14_9PLEO|nr:hypothetical protein EJ02DRAFT_469414 [Clathrospora elynae]
MRGVLQRIRTVDKDLDDNLDDLDNNLDNDLEDDLDNNLDEDIDEDLDDNVDNDLDNDLDNDFMQFLYLRTVIGTAKQLKYLSQGYARHVTKGVPQGHHDLLETLEACTRLRAIVEEGFNGL